jgi:hypothetical protein
MVLGETNPAILAQPPPNLISAHRQEYSSAVSLNIQVVLPRNPENHALVRPDSANHKCRPAITYEQVGSAEHVASVVEQAYGPGLSLCPYRSFGTGNGVVGILVQQG